MDIVQRTNSILAAAEKALAEAASDAAQGGHYDAASLLIELASAVNGLSVNARERLTPRAVGPQVEITAAGSIAVTESSRSAQLGTRQRKESYPKFLREGESLVKVGWSRSDKSVYEHKSPKRVLLVLAAAIEKAGARGKRFSMNRILPLTDSADGTRIPYYQVYLCLAWFRGLGFLIQHGRQGYSLAAKAPFEPLVEANWSSLPSR